MSTKPVAGAASEQHRIGVGAHPRFAWLPAESQRAANVEVSAKGVPVWTSGVVETDLPEVSYAGPPLTSRTPYTWRVRTVEQSGRWSEWSEAHPFETGLLHPEDWCARWITATVPDESRQVRAMPDCPLEWASAGEVLRQPFHVHGPLLGANLDLRFADGTPARGSIRLLTATGAPVAESPLIDWGFPPDRFSSAVFPAQPAPAGDYVAELRVEEGVIGWHRGLIESTSSPAYTALGLVADYQRNGAPCVGPLALGVDVVPAPNPEFRYCFDLDRVPARARLYGAGLGYATFFLNGRRVGHAVLDPAQTAYDRRVDYATHDVTALLQAGRNEIVARTGRGFWSVRGANVWGWNLAPWTSEPAVIAQLECEDDAGTRTTVSSGTHWSTRPSDIVEDLMFTGVTHRPQRAQASWVPAVQHVAVSGVLTPRTAPRVLEGAPLSPASVVRGPRGTVLDFGRVLTGTVRVELAADAAGRLRIKYGEIVGVSGDVVCENVLVSGEAQVDQLVLDARVESLGWQPEFSYKGFRYVQLECDDTIDVVEVVAVPYVAEVERVGAFDCDDSLLSWVAEATATTLLNNLHGVPTDTPIYEKNGWTADAHLIAESALRTFDLRDLLIKWLDDHVDSADASGVVPQIVPTPGWGRRLDPAWSGSMILLPWALYWEYGDLEVIGRYLEPMNRFLDRTLTVAADGNWIWPLHSWGDWLAPGEGFAPEGPAPMCTMAVLELADRLAQMNEIAGSAARALTYRNAEAQLRQAYHDAYFDLGTGTYRRAGLGYRQTMNAMPLALGAVPPEHVASVVSGLVEDLEHRTAGHLDCGATGIKHLLPALSRHGRLDAALTVVGQQTEPGWGAWRSSGDGTLWEAWSGARSHNHYFLGSVTAWLHENVAGLRQTSPGWASMTVAPPDDARVRRASSTHRSVRGMAAVSWIREPEVWRVTVDVPHGAKATLVVPGNARRSLDAGHSELTVPVVEV